VAAALQAERLGRLQIDHKLEFGWEQHRQIKDIDTPEYMSSINSLLTIRFGVAGSVAHQSANV